MKQQENRAEPQEKQIRFIDSHYNLKFYIPDGGKIRITFRDGHTVDRVCKYIDDYHCLTWLLGCDLSFAINNRELLLL